MIAFLKRDIFYLLLGSTLIYLTFNMHRHEARGILFSDAEGYYMYLPALFIYHGFEDVPVNYEKQFSAIDSTNRIYTKYTCGVAIMEAPFFLIAHALTTFSSHPTDGYSYLYRVSIMIAGVFYLLCGFILLERVLKKHFSILVTRISLLLLLAGTNLYFYTISQPGMSHVYSFFLFAAFIYLTPKFINDPDWKSTLIISLITGLIILIRPTNIIILLYPVFYDFKNNRELLNRFKRSVLQVRQLLIIIPVFILPFIPQIIYWHYISGSWIVYSYGDEGFIYWNHPQILKVLFGVWNGWFIYSPLAVMMVVPLIYLFKSNLYNARIILIILIISTYLFSSWWAYWFGAAFGHRCYVEYYTFMLFPFAFLISRVIQKRNVVSYCMWGIIAIFCYYNLRLTYFYNAPWDGPDWTWNSLSQLVRQMI